MSLHRGGSRSALAIAMAVVAGATTPAEHADAQTGHRWTISARAQFTVGDGTNADALWYQFGNVVGATRLSTGVVLIADASTNEIREYTRAGRFTRVLSRTGSGPSEFRGMTAFLRRSNTLYVGEMYTSTVTTLDETGAEVSKRRIPGEVARGPAVLVDASRPTAVLITAAPLRASPIVEGLHFDSVFVGITSLAAASPPNWIGSRQNRVRVVVHDIGGSKPFRSTVSLFHPQLSVFLIDTVAYVASGDVLKIERFDMRGRAMAPIPLPAELMSQSQARWRDLERKALADAEDGVERRLITSLYSSAARLVRFPYFARAVAGFGNEIWLERFRADPTSPADYVVVSVTGEMIAEVRGVPPVRLVEVGLDYVIGVATDAAGVQSVSVYLLDRRGK
jgi:hypothetical protein